MTLYYRDRSGRMFEFEAFTKADRYAWFRDLETDESVRLAWALLTPVSDAAAKSWAQSVLSAGAL